MAISTSQIETAIANPVRSERHIWEGTQQADYDSLRGQGRTLYDTLRTAYDVNHERAFCIALVRFGRGGGAR